MRAEASVKPLKRVGGEKWSPDSKFAAISWDEALETIAKKFLQLRDAGGSYYSFRKSELKELRRLKGETPMPSYEGQIVGAALDDLVAYLVSLKGKP